jgi:RNA:NAD 2'-phosphotransferase (TPT1/KptA family)
MTKQQKDLVWLLLQEDHYMVKTINAKGREMYKVLEGRQKPVRHFSTVTVNGLKDLFKTDDKKRFTLNLNLVRQLHGKSYIKILYTKTRKAKQDGSS